MALPWIRKSKSNVLEYTFKAFLLLFLRVFIANFYKFPGYNQPPSQDEANSFCAELS